MTKDEEIEMGRRRDGSRKIQQWWTVERRSKTKLDMRR